MEGQEWDCYSLHEPALYIYGNWVLNNKKSQLKKSLNSDPLGKRILSPKKKNTFSQKQDHVKLGKLLEFSKFTLTRLC